MQDKGYTTLENWNSCSCCNRLIYTYMLVYGMNNPCVIQRY